MVLPRVLGMEQGHGTQPCSSYMQGSALPPPTPPLLLLALGPMVLPSAAARGRDPSNSWCSQHPRLSTRARPVPGGSRQPRGPIDHID